MNSHAVAAFFLTAATLTAQRPDATFEWQKRTTAIAYGAVPVANHTLEELPVGGQWRLGMNDASTWQLSMPILAGENWLAPGSYRVQLHRRDQTTCSIFAEGSGRAVGGTDSFVDGSLGKAEKPNKKLTIEWTKNGAVVDGNQPARIVVQFGPDRWQGDVLVLGHKLHSVPGGRLAVFTVPMDRMDARGTAAVPIATLALDKDQRSWNLVLDTNEVRCVPWMKAPVDDFGFGEIQAPEDAAITKGTVAAVEAKVEKAVPALEAQKPTVSKGELALVVAFGRETLQLRVPLPKGGER